MKNMHPFEILKEYVKRGSILDSFQETTNSISDETSNGYWFEYRHHPEQFEFLQSIHPHPLMVVTRTWFLNDQKQSEQWMFYVRELDAIVHLQAKVWENDRFQNPKVSCWESNEQFETQGVYQRFENLQPLAKPIVDHVTSMPAYRLFYVTQNVEKVDLKKFI